jgi:hypothetical protein
MTPQIRRMAVFFCLTAILLAAVMPASAGLLLAIVLPLCFVIAISLSVVFAVVEERNHPLVALYLPAFSPRPPPTR